MINLVRKIFSPFVPSLDFDYVKAIQGADMNPLVVTTDVDSLPPLEAKYLNRIWLKREDQQPVFSFKLRGAFNKLKKLPSNSQVITASAGNHAQGLALSAQHFGFRASIYMPRTTPQIKIDAVRRLGGNVCIHGDNFDQANSKAMNAAKETGSVFVPPFDDRDVIVGQGTVARELLQQLQHIDVVFIPVGGGGLLAGMSVLLKSICPSIQVIGVEAQGSACLLAAIEAGKPVDLDYVNTFADGVAVKRIGEETYRLAKMYCDDVITVSSDEICAAMQDIFNNIRAISEPSGALSLAGLKKWCQQTGSTGKDLVAILSGANLNFNTLRYVAERTALGQKNEALLAVTIPEQRGSFKTFCKAIHSRPITEFNYRFAPESDDAHIFVGIGLRNGADELEIVKEELTNAGYDFVDLSNDELAKLHLRHMVGGRGGNQQRERLFRFDFPEYPGALLNFLETLGPDWNISLFHYRNLGGAIGNVLAGIDVNEEDDLRLQEHLLQLNYCFSEETNNPCYQRFLG